MAYKISSSNKSGINTPQNYIITRDGELYLRLIGEHPNYLLITATTDEDDNVFKISNSRKNLILAAYGVAKEFKTDYEELVDRNGKRFIRICKTEGGINISNDDISNQLEKIILRFFEIYDQLTSQTEMCNLYQDLFVHDNEDVYLGDGMWLDSQGNLIEK